MNFCKFCKDLTTGKDNETHDVIRVAIAIMTFLFPAIVVWSVIIVTFAWALNKPFDIVSTEAGIGGIFVAFGTFLMQGGGSLYFKRTTEPDGSHTEITSIKSGTAADGPTVDKTIINQTTVQG